MNISDLITNTIPVTLSHDDDVSLALETMFWSRVRHLPVLRDGLLAGIVSERDLLAHQASWGQAGGRALVRTLMTTPVIVASPRMPVERAMAMMLERRLGCLPVVEGRALVGIVTRSDLLSAGLPQSLHPVPRNACTRSPAPAPSFREISASGPSAATPPRHGC